VSTQKLFQVTKLLDLVGMVAKLIASQAVVGSTSNESVEEAKSVVRRLCRHVVNHCRYDGVAVKPILAGLDEEVALGVSEAV
jgi:hypothetical protein